ncbi:mitochondrial fission ELM1 family protein [Planctomicrobium sp. SH664]|uniref:mitochondrial fission ELM1 family protein n=1 Tax=Planctomicrobium sp. SH664 TaxID=3448125 RepID=UPI003F5B8C65
MSIFPFPPSSANAPGCFSWGIADGAAGHGSQVRGLTEGLGGESQVFDCTLAAPWKYLPGFCVPRQQRILRAAVDLNSPAPRVLVSCGRQAATASWILRHNEPRTFAVHLQHPQSPLERFDLIVVPEHDGLTGRNVVTTRGALHPLSPAALATAAAKGPMGGLEQFDSPFVAVLLGGPNRYFPFTPEDTARLAHRLQQVAAAGHRLAIIPSRRTPAHAISRFETLFGQDHLVWTGKTENPYRSALALASHLIVTGDSISMVSEANATGRPVYVEMLNERRPARKFARFHQLCQQRGLIRPFTGELEDWSYEPLYEAGRIAALIHDRLANSTLRAAG